MRGHDEQQLGVFSYVNSEQRIPHDHPLRQLRAMADEALRELKPRFSRLYAKTGRPSIAPGEVVACVAAPSVVLRAQRTDADGATRLQLVVPLVCGTEHGRSDLECDGVHEESAASAGRRHRRRFFRSRTQAGTFAGLAVGRALHSGWNSTGGMGRTEELSPCR